MSLEDVFYKNNGRMNNKKYVIHANRWDIFINKNQLLIKGVFCESFRYNTKKVVWEVVNDNVVDKSYS